MHLSETCAARTRATSVAAAARLPDPRALISISLLSVVLILLSGAEWMRAI